ncbi:hypothetical protein ACNFU2_17630 [Chryseobacterium sp. PTM-20240506]|uniref:hypothetical protein n=1 Tax=Chryseobacterium sp. PTM-20240506 TaxID=3400631 RepID=UPI003AAB0DB8
MLDFLKFRTFNQNIIIRLVNSKDFERSRSKGSHTLVYQHKKHNIKLECRKSKLVAENEFIFIDILITPHYYFNSGKHNGNDFNPENCKNILQEIFSILKIEQLEYNELQLINLEYGVNVLPESDVKNLIEGILYHKKTPFVSNNKIKTYKITDATTFKQIKAYGKGIQFINMPQFGIDINTFRFEVRTKQTKNIRKLGIYTLCDLFQDNTYRKLAESLLKEWDNILIINLEPNLKGLNPAEAKYISEVNTIDFWSTKLKNPYRNTFAREMKKYYNKSKGKNNLHHELKVRILDKIFYLLTSANSIQKTPMKPRLFKN